jgi:hypothetical protein
MVPIWPPDASRIVAAAVVGVGGGLPTWMLRQPTVAAAMSAKRTLDRIRYLALVLILGWEWCRDPLTMSG